MTAKKFYFIFIGLVVALLLALGIAVFFMNSLLVKSSSRLVTAKLDSRVSEERERYYIQAKKDVEKYKDVGDTLSKVLPKDKDQARAVAEIYRIADETNTSIKQISFPSSTLGDKKATAPAAGAAATPSASTTTKVTTVTQTKPVEGVSGVLAVDTQIQFSKSMTYQQLISFLEKVEKNRRNMQISAITVTPEGNQLDIQIAIRIFVKP